MLAGMFTGLDYPSLSDSDLARRIVGAPPGRAQGEEGELFRRFARPVRLYGLRHLRDKQSASDLVQTVLTRTIEKLRTGQVREPDKIASFVLGVARMTTREMVRKGGRERPLETEHLEQERLTLPPSQEQDRSEPFSLKQLADCLEGLSERERAVVLLTFFNEQTSAEIAEALAVSRGNVRVIRHRAIARLRGCMDTAQEAAP